MAVRLPPWTRAGAWTMLRRRGVKHLAYIQVDNPLADLCDPTLLGHHLMAQSEMTTQVVRKREPLERVGNVVQVDGRIQIIEYSDLPEEAAEGDLGRRPVKALGWQYRGPRHRCGFSGTGQPSRPSRYLFTGLSRKSPICQTGVRWWSPETPNATKFERFIFDLLPEAKNAFVVEAKASRFVRTGQECRWGGLGHPETGQRGDL